MPMDVIRSKTPGFAWKQALNKVYFQGLGINDGEKKLKELLNVFIIIENPLESDSILEEYADKKMIQLMIDNFLKKEAVFENISSYGSKLFDYHGFNQLEYVVEKLKKNPESKSATITFTDPIKDKTHVPCIISFDLKIRNGELIGTAFFRSQDVGKKLCPDAIALCKVMEMIAKDLDVKLGFLNILAVSLHLYEEDMEKFMLLIN